RPRSTRGATGLRALGPPAGTRPVVQTHGGPVLGPVDALVVRTGAHHVDGHVRAGSPADPLERSGDRYREAAQAGRRGLDRCEEESPRDPHQALPQADQGWLTHDNWDVSPAV